MTESITSIEVLQSIQIALAPLLAAKKVATIAMEGEEEWKGVNTITVQPGDTDIEHLGGHTGETDMPFTIFFRASPKHSSRSNAPQATLDNLRNSFGFALEGRNLILQYEDVFIQGIMMTREGIDLSNKYWEVSQTFKGRVMIDFSLPGGTPPATPPGLKFE